MGFYCAVYLSTLPGVEKMTIVDRQSDRARALHAHLESRLSHIRLAHTERIVGASDVVVLATDSYQPLLGRQNNPAQLVISLGADTLDQAELEDDWAALPVIHTDSRDSLNYGDLARWHRQGALRPEQLADLLDLVHMTDMIFLLVDQESLAYGDLSGNQSLGPVGAHQLDRLPPVRTLAQDTGHHPEIAAGRLVRVDRLIGQYQVCGALCDTEQGVAQPIQIIGRIFGHCGMDFPVRYKPAGFRQRLK